MSHRKRASPELISSDKRFLHQGTQYELLRFSPQEHAAMTQLRGNQQASVILPILANTIRVDAIAIAAAQDLVYLHAVDDSGETFGVWCFAENVVLSSESDH